MEVYSLIDPYIARTSKTEVKFKSLLLLLYVLALIAVHSVWLGDRAQVVPFFSTHAQVKWAESGLG